MSFIGGWQTTNGCVPTAGWCGCLPLKPPPSRLFEAFRSAVVPHRALSDPRIYRDRSHRGSPGLVKHPASVCVSHVHFLLLDAVLFLLSDFLNLSGQSESASLSTGSNMINKLCRTPNQVTFRCAFTCRANSPLVAAKVFTTTVTAPPSGHRSP